MITLYRGSGAGDFSIKGIKLSVQDFDFLRHNAVRLLQLRGHADAVELLRRIPFECLEASNHFGDEFSILHAVLPLTIYDNLRGEAEKDTVQRTCREITETFQELGLYIRFIAVDLQLESEQAGPAWKLTPAEVNKVVNGYLGVSMGYLADFSYRTHQDFYSELGLAVDTNAYQGTTRSRFVQILEGSNVDAQARILDGILRKYPVGSSTLRTKERKDEIAGWIAKLKGVSLTSASRDESRGLAGAGQHSQSSPESTQPAGGTFRFDFGISFCGDHRILARQIRDGLKNVGFSVFFDEDFEHEMVGHDGTTFLRNVYSRECRFCIVLISRSYDQRNWTDLEREAVQSRELRGERGVLIPVPIEDYQPAWLPESRIRFDLWKRSIPELVALLTKRARFVQT